MSSDVSEARRWMTTQPFDRVLVEETFQHGLRLHRNRARYSYRLLQDHLEQEVLGVLVGVVGGADDVERRPAGEHLVEQHAERPPIDAEICGKRKSESSGESDLEDEFHFLIDCIASL